MRNTSLSTLRGLVKCTVDLSNDRSLQYLYAFKRDKQKDRYSSTPEFFWSSPLE